MGTFCGIFLCALFRVVSSSRGEGWPGFSTALIARRLGNELTFSRLSTEIRSNSEIRTSKRSPPPFHCVVPRPKCFCCSNSEAFFRFMLVSERGKYTFNNCDRAETPLHERRFPSRRGLQFGSCGRN